MKTIEEGIREGIAELFWGSTRKEGSEVKWEWDRSKPCCNPGEDRSQEASSKSTNYSQYCKEVFKEKSARKEAVKSFSHVGDPSVKEEMERLLSLTLKKMQLRQDVRYTKEAMAAGLKGPTINMFPTVFSLVASLQRSKRVFAVLFRSFGGDHMKIRDEWNSFCEGTHPVYSHLLEGTGPLDGSNEDTSVPDRRIQGMHTLYRDKDGPILILDKITNGPTDASWDAWAKTKPKPDKDTRAGRDYIKKVLKCKTHEGIPKIQQWMRDHLLKQTTAAIKDDWAWWTWNEEKSSCGKLLTLIGGKSPTKQLFYDDNVEADDARIVDCRDANGSTMPNQRTLGKLCVKVNPVEAVLDDDYFIRKV
jgi:hypothetical protein